MQEREAGPDEWIQIVEKSVAHLHREVRRLRGIQPDCGELKGKYDEQFRKYRTQVEQIIKEINETREKLQDFASEEVVTAEVIEKYVAWVKKNMPSTDPSVRVMRESMQCTITALRMKMRQQNEENYKELRARSKALIKKLQSYRKNLSKLMKPTHKWEWKHKKRNGTVFSDLYDINYVKDKIKNKYGTMGHKLVESRFCAKCGEEE